MSRRPFHPLLFAALPALNLFADNFHEVPWSVLAGSLALVVAFTLLVWGLLRATLLRERHRAALFATPLALAILSFNRAPRWVASVLPHADATTYALVILGPLVALGVLAVVLRRSQRDLSGATGALNFAGVAVLALLCVRVGAAQVAAAKRPSAPAPALPESLRAEVARPAEAPSIYVLVADAHARPDLLQKIYGVDPAPFVDGLRAQGFRVVEGSRTNYDRTSRAVPSLLGLDYLPPGFQASVHKDPEVPAAAAFAKSLGYTFVGLESVVDVDLRAADVYVRRPVHWGEFGRELFGTLFFWQGTFEAQEGRRIHAFFDELQKVAGARPRQFVVAHVMAPHAPYVFDRDGNETQTWEFLPRDEALRQYGEQVRYVDRRLLETIRTVVEKEKPSPIIVLVSDHGPWEFYDETAPRQSFLLNHFANLIAVRLPSGSEGCVWDGMTLVNVLRGVFNCQFGTRLERLPDRSFVYEDGAFSEVTERIGSAEDWAHLERLMRTESVLRH